jgi:glycerol kinase
MSYLVIDVGTSSIRTCMVRADGSVSHEHRVLFLPQTPFAGLVEFDPIAMLGVVVDAARETLRVGGPAAAVGIANQRGSTVVWDATTGLPVAPGLGWQDLRTIGACMEMKSLGFAVPPNASATKVSHLLDLYDANRTNVNLRFGTIESWLIWNLTERSVHVTDASNAGITSMVAPSVSDPATGMVWRREVLDALRIPDHVLPSIVDSFGIVGPASVLPGSPPIAAILGDQQASLLGQGCVSPGDTKATFGTGGMVDVVTGSRPPSVLARLDGGTFPIATQQRGGTVTWGLEAIMLSAGTAVEWLRDDLSIITSSAESAEVAAECVDADGVVFVPALLGLATPHWDYGARGTLVGMTRGTSRTHIVRAVLEGVALRGSDLVSAAAADAGVEISRVRMDGGMSANPVFVQAFADACNRPVEVSPILEATALGAGLGAALAMGELRDLAELASVHKPMQLIEPSPNSGKLRQRWDDAVSRSREWIPALSALDF